MKRLILLVLALTALLGSPVFTQVGDIGVPTEEVIGDLNGDRKVDIRDVQLSLKVALGIENLPPEKLLHADLRPRSPWGGPLGDGKITVADTAAHLLLALSLIKVEPSYEVVLEKEKAIPMERQAEGVHYIIDGRFWSRFDVWDSSGKYLGEIHEVYNLPVPEGQPWIWLYGVDKYNKPIITQEGPKGEGVYIFDPQTREMKLVAPLWYKNMFSEIGYPIIHVIELTDPRFEKNKAFKNILATSRIPWIKEELRFFLAEENVEIYHLYVVPAGEPERYPGVPDYIYEPFEAPGWAPGSGVGFPLSYWEPVIEVPSYDYQIFNECFDLLSFSTNSISLDFYRPPAVATGNGYGGWKREDILNPKTIEFPNLGLRPAGKNLRHDFGITIRGDPIVVGDKLIIPGPRLEIAPWYEGIRSKTGRVIEQRLVEPDPSKVRIPVFNYRVRKIRELQWKSSGYTTATIMVFDTKTEKISLTDIGIEFFPEPEKGFVDMNNFIKIDDERFYVNITIRAHGEKNWPALFSKEYMKGFYMDLPPEENDQWADFLIPAFLRKRLIEPTPGL